MTRCSLRLTVLSLLLFVTTASGQTQASFRVLLGVADATPARWDGTVTTKEVGKYNLEGWRFEGDDKTEGNRFHLSTHYPKYIFSDPSDAIAVANGFIVNAEQVDDNSEFTFATAQGNFSFRPSEVPYGVGVYKLAGDVFVDRVSYSIRLTDTKDEEDFPSVAAAPNGDAWLAYIQFHHAPDYEKLRRSILQAPKNFDAYTEPPGGDQIWARRFSGGKWSAPIALTDAGGDFYRTAVAIEGSGRAWVFWSKNHGGNFDIFARAVDASGAKETLQISDAPGSDIDPVAVTDANGRVWVAWQGWRNGVAAIFVSHQQGNGFSQPEQISHSSKNEWDPAIAADRTGRVAVAWDSYRNGNYDVFERTAEPGGWGEEVPLAASERYEAYPSIAFDPSGRLWVAYEEGGQGWGKDFGAYSSPGVPLYEGRLIKLRGIDPYGTVVTLNASLDSALVGVPSWRADHPGSQIDSDPLDPQPLRAAHRQPGQGPQEVFPLRMARNTAPRLVVDGSGRFWLVFRTEHPMWVSPVGGVWTEFLVTFNGKEWTNPIFLNHTDNLLDNRPAVVSTAEGKLLMVDSSDGRRNYQVAQAYAEGAWLSENASVDPYNNDLWSQLIDLGPSNQVIPVSPVGAGAKTQRPTIDKANAAGIQALHDFRGGPDRNLRIVRGEFHRHSEIDTDGYFDGTLLDQWRYALDTAGLDWIGCCDHDYGNDREYSWWITQKQTDVFYTPNVFIPMFSYERGIPTPEGHRNVVFAQRGIRPLPHLFNSLTSEDHPVHAPDTQMLYAYLRQFNGIVATHHGASSGGTDWRDNDPVVEPVVEIYQGLRHSYEMPESPRAISADDPIFGYYPKGWVSNALNKGYRLAFESSSDHLSTHMSYCILYVKDLTREAVIDAFHKRHVYAATDDILADVESGNNMMGDEFSTATPPTLMIKLRGTSKFAKVTVIRDGQSVYTTSPNAQEVEFSWRDYQPNKDKTSYYYVRGEQDNGELVWASPLWIKYSGN